MTSVTKKKLFVTIFTAFVSNGGDKITRENLTRNSVSKKSAKTFNQAEESDDELYMYIHVHIYISYTQKQTGIIPNTWWSLS